MGLDGSAREFWFNFVKDQAGPVSASNGLGATSADGNVTASGFVGHRRMIEPEHPLELDLLAVGLDVLPESLQKWQMAKVSDYPLRWNAGG